MNAKIWGRWLARLFKQGPKRLQRRSKPRSLLHCETLEDRLTPTTYTWTGLGGSSDWSIAKNWGGNVAPSTATGAINDLVFGPLAATAALPTTNNISGLVVNSITFSGDTPKGQGYDLGGDAITLVGPISVGASLGAETIALNLTLTPSAPTLQQTFTVNSASTLDISGALTGSESLAGGKSAAIETASETLNKSGAGTLQLDGNNTYFTGAIDINSGILAITNSDALGIGNSVSGVPTAGTTTVATGAQLQVNGTTAALKIPEQLILNGSGIINDGALLNTVGSNNTWAGPITMDSNSTLGANANTTLNISGLIADVGSGFSLTKAGKGTIVFNRVGGNTYRGQTIINNGILEIEDPLSLGAGAISSSTQSGTPQAETIVNYNSTTGVAGTLELNFNGALGANDPNGILQNPALAYNNTVKSSSYNPYIGFQVFNDTLVLNGPGFSGLGALYNLAGNNSWDGNVELGSPSNVPNTGNVSIGVSATSPTNLNTTLTISGVVSSVTPLQSPVANLLKIGGGNLALNDSNTFTGNVFIENGAINVGDSNALGSAATNNVYVGFYPDGAPTGLPAALQMQVDSGYDGTSAAGVLEMTHYRNLGYDSDPVNASGPAQEIDVTGTSGTFTLNLTSYTVTGLQSNYSTTNLNIADPNFIADLQAAVVQMLDNAGYNASTSSVTVTEDLAGSGSGNLYRIAFSGAMAGQDIPLMTATITSPPVSPTATAPTVAVNADYALTITNPLTLIGNGLGTGNGTGALESISGSNTYTGPITLDGAVAIGVDADSRTGHNLADSNYLADDYSLTISGNGTTSGIVAGGGINKVGFGDLILPTANDYTGANDIEQGWVTVENNESLGVQQDLTQTLQSYTTVASGAAVMLDDVNAASGDFLTLANNFLLSGNGITPGTLNKVTTPNVFGLIDQEGALENLDGNNLLTGIIQLNGSAGIGVEQVFNSGTNAPTSQLTISGPIWNDATGTAGSINKLGSRRLVIAGPGTYTGGVTISQGVILLQNSTGLGVGNTTTPTNVIVQSGAALELANTVSALEVSNSLGGNTYTSSENGGIQEGLNIEGMNLELNGTGDPTFGDTPLTVLSSNAATTGPEVQNFAVSPSGSFTLSYGGQTTSAFTIGAAATTPAAIQTALDALTSIANFAGAYATVQQNGNVYLITIVNPLAANLGYAVSVNPVVPASTGNAADDYLNTTQIESTSETLAPVNDPLISTDNFWNGPVALNNSMTITVPTNSRLILGGTVSDGTNATASGYGGSGLTFVGGGELDLDGNNTYSGTTYINQGVVTAESDTAFGATGVPEIQSVKLTGATANSTKYILTFTSLSNVVTPTAAITYTGNVTKDESAIANALNGLSTIGGAGDVGGSVSVTEVISNTGVTITVTFGGTLTGFQQNLLNASVISGPGSIAVSPLTPATAGAGGTFVANGASLQLAGSITIAGEPLIVQGNGSINDTQVLSITGQSGTGGGYYLTFTGADASGNVVTDTTPVELTTSSDATDIKTAIDELQNVGEVGGTVSVAAETIQTITVPTGATGTFTLSLTGVDSTNTTVTETTVPLNAASLTLTNDIQTALDALSNIGGVGGSVTVTESSPGVFTVAFGGSLAGQTSQLLTVNNSGITGNPVTAALDTTDQVFSITFGGTLAGEALQTMGVQYAAPLASGVNVVTTQVGASALENLPTQWFQVGPSPITGGQTAGNANVAGTVTDIAVDPEDPNTIYISTAGGGVWKTQNGGQNWYPIFDSIPEIQTVTVAASTGNFTLSFTSTTGTNDTTIPLNSADSNLALDMQNALDALGDIGGAGGLVTVFQSSSSNTSNTYEITFGGELAGYKEAVLTSSATAAKVKISELEAGASPQFALFVGAIAIDPDNPNVIYVGTGVANNSADSYYGTGIYESQNAGVTWTLMLNDQALNTNVVANPFYGRGISSMQVDPETGDLLVADGDSTQGQDEVQTLQFIPNPTTGAIVNPFQVSLTAADSTGALTLQKTPEIPNYAYTGGVWVDPITDIAYFGDAATADALQYYMNQFTNIGGVGGFVVVQNTGFQTFTITFEGTLSYFTEPAVVTSYPLPETSLPAIGVQVSAVAGPTTVVNGTMGGPGSAPGIWEFSSNTEAPSPVGTWQDLTDVVSQLRSSVASPNTNDPIYGPDGTLPGQPDTPGPDDDYQVYFPQSNATWSDLEIVDGVSGEILLAALGSSSIGTVNSYNAKGVLTGTPANGVFWSTNFNDFGFGFGFGNTVTWYQGDIYNSGVFTPDNESSTMFPSPYYVGDNSGQAPESGNIKISAVAFEGTYSDDPINFGLATIYASVSTAGGSLENIYVSTDGGVDWAAVPTLPSPVYMSGEGQYDNAIYVVNEDTVYVAGQDASGTIPGQPDQIWETTDGGNTWIPVNAIGGVGPHDSQHVIVDDDGTGLLFGNDGGITLLSTTNGDQTPVSWEDINGDLSTAQITSIASDPASIAGIASNPVNVTVVAGVANNGTIGFSDGQTWSELDDSAGEVSTVQVYIDPTNPNIIYEEQTQLGSGNGPLIRVSTNDGSTWTTIFQNPAAITPTTPNEILSASVPLVMDTVNPERLLVGGGYDGGVYETLDGSSASPTWINVGATLPIEATVIGQAEFQGNFTYDPNFPGVSDQGANSYVPNTFYVSDGTSVYVTKNDGQTWINADPTLSTTPLGDIVQLVVDPRNMDTVYAVVNGFNQGGVWVSYDSGAQWSQIGTNNGLPNVPVDSLVVDPRNNNLYVGTDLGVFQLIGGASNSGGTPTGSWQQFGAGLPVVQVTALELNETTNTLLAGTDGQGVFELFLDNAETAPAPVSTSAVTGLSGPTFWTGPVILAGNVTFGADGAENLPNNIAAGSVDFVGQISDMVSGASPSYDPVITKVGGGDVIFAGANTYDGLTVVQQGNLIVDNEQALGAGETIQGVNDTTDGTIVDQGASLELESNLGSETVTLNGDGSSFDGHYTGSLSNISGDNSYTGNVIFGTDDPNSTITLNADSGSVLTLTGGIVSDQNSSQSGISLVKEGTGTIAVGDGNTYTGSTYVYQGALEVENDAALGVATGQNGVTVLDGAQLQMASGVTVSALPLTLSGTGISGTGALLNLSGVNTWLGDVIFALLPGFSQFTFPLGDIAIGVDAGSTLTIDGTVSELQQSGQLANPNDPADNGYKTLGQESGLNKVGGGTLVLQNPYSTTSQSFSSNTFSGGVTVAAGTVVAGDSGALGTHPTVDSNLGTVQQVVVLGEDLSAAPGSFQLSFNGATSTLAGTTSAIALEGKINGPDGLFAKAGFVGVNAIVEETSIETSSESQTTANLGEGNLYTITFGGPLLDTTLPLSATGSDGIQAAASFVTAGGDDVLVDTGAELDLNTTLANALASATTQIDVTGHTVTLNGSGLSGNGALQNTAGDNTWDGPVVIQSGPSSTGTSSPSPKLNASIAATSGTSLTLVDPVSITVPAGTLIAPTLTLGGAGAAGAGTLIIPAGTTQPTTSNGLDSTTVVTGGDVQVDGSLGKVQLVGSTSTNSGGTLDAGGAISGLGSVGAIIDAGATSGGGIVNPGDNGDSTLLNPINTYPVEGLNENTVGTLTASSVTLSKVDAFDVYVGDPAIPNSSDLLSVTGGISLGGSTLSGYVNPDVILTVGSPPPPPVTIITAAGGVTGQFLGTSTTPTEGGNTATIAYIDNERFEVDYFNTYVTITRVPETVTLGKLTVSVPPGAPLPPQPPTTVSPPTAAVYYGEDVSVSLTLTPESSQVILNGTVVEFQIIDPYNNVFQFAAPVTLVSGDVYTATIDVPDSLLEPLATGTSPGYQISAYYEGYDPTSGAVLFSPASDGVVQGYTSTVTGTEEKLEVVPTPTSTTLAVSQSVATPLPYGTELTFTATVSGSLPTADLAQLPSGSLPIQAPETTVDFYDTQNGVTTLLGAGTLISTGTGSTVATATFTTSTLPDGAHSITATYAADGIPDNYTTSTSATPITFRVTAASDTMSLQVSPTTIGYNGQATLTATVTPPAGNMGLPTGSVTFTDGSLVLGTATLYTVNGVTSATLTTSAFQIPADANVAQTITASYAGDGNFEPESATASLTVDPIATTTTIAAPAQNSQPAGEPYSFTATVTPSALGGASPTGTVTFVFTNTSTNATIEGSSTLSTLFGLTTATYSTSQLPQGTYSVTANYSGDSNYLTSTGDLTGTVTVTSAITTITVSAPATVVAAQAVPITATVDTTTGGVATEGTVVFIDTTTGNTLGSAPVVNGQAYILAILGPPLGRLGFNDINASFTDTTTNTFNPSTTTVPAVVDVVANGTRKSTVTLTSSLNPATLGQSVTFTATVKDAGAGAKQTPTGSVVFVDKTTGMTLGYGLLSTTAGVTTATLTTSNFQQGNNSIVATYSGSPLFASVASAALNELVNGILTSSVTVASSSVANQSSYGQAVTFTATVLDTSSTVATPTGAVTFTIKNNSTNAVVSGTVKLTTSTTGKATATFTTTSLSTPLVAGTYTVTATYNGDSNFLSGSNGSLTQTVVPDTSTTTLTGSTSSFYGQSVTYKATVKASVSGVVPTGTVTFGYLVNGTLVPLGTATVVTNATTHVSTATFTTKTLAPNDYTIEAVYNGTPNIGASTSGAVALTVNMDNSVIGLAASTNNSNTSVTFTASVTAASPGAGVPTGTMSFYINGVFEGTVNLNAGKAALTLPGGLPTGSYTVEAVYSGDDDFNSNSVSKVFTFVTGRGT